MNNTKKTADNQGQKGSETKSLVVSDVKTWLKSDQFRAAINKSLPKHLTADRFVRIALTAMMKEPKIAQCSQESLFQVLLDLSSLGLEPDGRRAHIIPFRNKGVLEAQLLIDYKGLIELAKRSGEVVCWRAEAVCDGDEFSWQDGIVYHKIDWLKPRGKLLAAYSHVKNKDGIDEYEVMTAEQIEGIRKRSKAANCGPWKSDYKEMAKKTVIRRHSKRLVLSQEFNEAIVKDDEGFSGFDDDLPSAVDLMPKRKSDVKAEKKEQTTPDVSGGASEPISEEEKAEIKKQEKAEAEKEGENGKNDEQ